MSETIANRENSEYGNYLAFVLCSVL